MTRFYYPFFRSKPIGGFIGGLDVGGFTTGSCVGGFVLAIGCVAVLIALFNLSNNPARQYIAEDKIKTVTIGNLNFILLLLLLFFFKC
jgi:hypothetical protein